MSILSVFIFISMIPGLISMIIIEELTIHKKENVFFFVVYSVLLGLVSYLILQLIYFIFGSMDKLLFVWSSITEGDFSHINLFEILCATLLSIPVGLFSVYFINKKLLYKIARTLKISYKYGDDSLFYYYLNSNEIDWVYIRDKEEGVVYQGRVESYSEGENIYEIVLTDVTVYTYYNQEKLYEVPSLYLCRRANRLQIEQIPKDKFKEEER